MRSRRWRWPPRPGPVSGDVASFRLLCGKLLPAEDSAAFPNDDEVVRLDARDLLRRSARPGDGQVGRGRGSESEVQAPVVRGVEARLGGPLLRLRAPAVTGHH